MPVSFLSLPVISTLMDYYRAVRRVLIMTFAVNVATALLKGAWGWLSGSLAMSADGLHSLFDSISNIIGLVGIGLASRPPDRDHPYGHSKYESFASLAIAAILFAGCFQLIVAAAGRLQGGAAPQVTGISFAIMGLTLAINIAVSAYEYRIGKDLKSSILVADSLHTRSDIYVSIGVILGFVAVRMGYPQADPIIALLISVLILFAGLEIIRDSSKTLLDRALLDEKEVADLAMSVEGVCSCHAVRTRGTEGEIFVDLHIGVDNVQSIESAHSVGEDVERVIKSRIPGVRDVVVHLEPGNYCDLHK